LKQRKVNFQENASEIIKSDDFLRSIYAEIYSTFFHISGNDASLRVLEIGAGGYSPSSAFWELVIVSDIEEHGDQNKGQKIAFCLNKKKNDNKSYNAERRSIYT
jgi:hypothetical protein